MKNWYRCTIFLILFLPVILFAGEIDIVNNILQDLKINYTWVESYKLNYWDCSTQSTTLWYILLDKKIKSKLVASIYFEKGEWKDHIFLIADLDGKIKIIDATQLEIRDPNPLKYGFYVVRFYDSPTDANAVWPGEYIQMEVKHKGR